jgi:deoxyhypusine synthase
MKRSDYLKRPIRHIDLTKTDGLGELVRALGSCSFQGRNLSRCLRVMEEMLSDDETVIFLGLSGAMVPAGMRKILADMVRLNMVDVLVSTGANISHDMLEGLGFKHYMGSERSDDAELQKHGLDRIYDTLAVDEEFGRMELEVAGIADELEARAYSSRELMDVLGSRIEDPGSILNAAHEEGVPLFVPALSDSAIGIGLTLHYRNRKQKGEQPLSIDQLRDNHEITQIREKAKRSGVIYIGGGVPKNYIQQLSPMMDTLGSGMRAHDYAIQITTDDPKWGGLSGCTFKEAQSWGKVSKSASEATVHVDATIGLPLIIGATMQTCQEIMVNRRKRKFIWNCETLEKIAYG